MKNRFLVIVTMFLTLISMIALPIDTKAKTVALFEAEIEKYTKELESRKAKIATNES